MYCEIILIGNELLIGKIQDTNGKWIINQLLPYGVEIRRITIIEDNLEEISSTIKNTLLRSPRYIFTSGGLGPTYDDMTLEGIALGLSKENHLVLNLDALEMIKQRYKKIYPNLRVEELMKPSRKKMAMLPKGSIPLKNPEGSAPGVLIPEEITNGVTKIICMPGIPVELQAIFQTHVLPKIKEEMKDNHFTQCGFTFQYIGESKFTEKVSEIVDNHDFPEIWIKTHPKTKKDKSVELHLTSFSADPGISSQMKKLYDILVEEVKKNNGKITEEHPLQ